MNVSKEGSKQRGVATIQENGHGHTHAASVGDLSALKDAIKRGEDVNSVNG